jgi:hypothetical protein
MRSSLKMIAINVFVLFVIINATVWVICIGNTAKQILRDNISTQSIIPTGRAALPNYANVDWAAKHFAEFDSLQTKYVPYIGWRRKAYSGTTITVSGPYLQRRTVARPDPKNPTVYFFGGSTMWGTGSNDDSTIPSQFSQLSQFPAENFGETAYTADQSLALLMRLLLDGRRPDIVVFYDGVNEVAHKCRVELNEWSHARETRMAAALEHEPDPMSVSHLFQPLTALAERIVASKAVSGGNETKHFDCHTDKGKAQRISDHLLKDWALARRLVESYNGQFIGVLQPVAYFSSTKLDHLKLSDALRLQFEAVYPLIEKKMERKSRLHNLVGALDHDEYIYVDFCHLSPNGNRYVAKEILQIIADEHPESLAGARMR